MKKSKEPLNIIELGRKHPDKWIESVLGCKLTAKQAEVARSTFHNARTAVPSCEGSGKSYDAARIALCFLYCYAPSTVITTAPSFRQVEEIIWREISLAFSGANHVRLPDGREAGLVGHLTNVKLDIADDHFAIGFSTDTPERFQGLHNKNVLVIGDEASGLSEETYRGMENPLATGHTRLLLIGNPTQPIGRFKDACMSPIYNTIHISAFDTPNFTEFKITLDDIKSGDWIKKMGCSEEEIKSGAWSKKMPYPMLIAPPKIAERLQEWGESSFMFQSMVLGEFPEAGENNLFRLKDIENAVDKEVSDEGDLIAGLDIARYGDSETVFVLKSGDKTHSLDGWSHADIEMTVGRVSRNLWDKPAKVTNIDATAIGGDDATLLENAGFNVDRILVGQPALDTERFVNKRAEYYWLLSKKFIDGTISIPNDKMLISQLSDIRYTYKKGRLLMESKEEMKSRGSKSPDRADALMLAFIPNKKSSKPRVWTWPKRRMYVR